MPDAAALCDSFREAIVQAAAGQLGAKDHRVADYWRDVLGVSWHGAFPPQWCGAFALWCLHQAGVAKDAIWHIAGCWPAHDSKGYGFLLVPPHALQPTATPRPGDISYKSAPFQHHAVVESFDIVTGVVRTIDGNQGPPDYIKRSHHNVRDAAFTHYSIEPLVRNAAAAVQAP